MNTAFNAERPWRYLLVLLMSSLASAQVVPQVAPTPVLGWKVVVNNGVVFPSPGETRLFNSYNQPSINVNNLVVFRARSKGGSSGEPAHGVLTRDMSRAGTPLTIIFDRTTTVPQPNNLGSLFIEPPSFPRIDMYSKTIASRGNHQPVWQYTDSTGADTRAGTTGIYTNPFGPLVSGANNLGAAPGFDFFSVPGGCSSPGAEPRQCTKFDVFPGAPAVADAKTIVFKGNFTTTAGGKTGVYFRNLTNSAMANPNGGPALEPAGGNNPVTLIADSDSYIPGTSVRFGSTAPPSAVKKIAVFAGFDNEDAPTLGGIYMVHLTGSEPKLIPLVKIGGRVPGENGFFNKLGEGLSFDGRFVAFWGAWGTETKTLTLQCPNDGNKDRLAFCQTTYPNGFTTTVPLHQGIFVFDTELERVMAIAKTPNDFDDFVYWNFSGLVPGTGESDDSGEPARWRSAEFMAVSGLLDGKLVGPKFSVAFKARKGQVTGESYVNPVDGIYIYNKQNATNTPNYITAVYTGMPGTLLDPQAVFVDSETPGAPPVVLPVTEMGLERDGFRGNSLVINASMGTEEAGWAGIYLTTVPK